MKRFIVALLIGLCAIAQAQNPTKVLGQGGITNSNGKTVGDVQIGIVSNWSGWNPIIAGLGYATTAYADTKIPYSVTNAATDGQYLKFNAGGALSFGTVSVSAGDVFTASNNVFTANQNFKTLPAGAQAIAKFDNRTASLTTNNIPIVVYSPSLNTSNNFVASFLGPVVTTGSVGINAGEQGGDGVFIGAIAGDAGMAFSGGTFKMNGGDGYNYIDINQSSHAKFGVSIPGFGYISCLVAGTEIYGTTTTIKGKFAVGSGTAMTNILTTALMTNFGTINAGATASIALPLSGAKASDAVALRMPETAPQGLTFSRSYCTNNVLILRADNNTLINIDASTNALYGATVTSY